MNNNIIPLMFTSIGHALMHMFAAFYFIIVLAIEDEWNISYDERCDLLQKGIKCWDDPKLLKELKESKKKNNSRKNDSYESAERCFNLS